MTTTRPDIVVGVCGHAHDSMEEEVSCELVQRIVQQLDLSAAVVLLNEDTGQLAGSLAGNVSSFALLARQLCEIALTRERPADCEKCAAAWDRLKLALSILEPTERCDN